MPGAARTHGYPVPVAVAEGPAPAPARSALSGGSMASATTAPIAVTYLPAAGRPPRPAHLE